MFRYLSSRQQSCVYARHHALQLLGPVEAAFCGTVLGFYGGVMDVSHWITVCE